LNTLERLVDLVILLVDHRTPLTFAQIRERMPEGYPQANLDSAKRMFERDKDAAREIGVPIEVSSDELGSEPAYTIRKDRFYLPEVRFSPEEVAAILLAVRGGTPQDPAAIAAGKLLSGLREMGDGGSGPSLGEAIRSIPVAGGDGAERLQEVWAAIAGRQAIRFAYRAADGARGTRTVDPFRIVFRAGRWYLVGHDRDRDGIRAFRLSRIASSCEQAGASVPVPPGFRAEDHISASPTGAGDHDGSARIAFAPHAAWPARRSVEVRSEVVRGDGWIELEIPNGDPEWLASWVLSYGEDAVVVAPEELRAEVVARLEAVLG
jgi:proteasome accessory factor B